MYTSRDWLDAAHVTKGTHLSPRRVTEAAHPVRVSHCHLTYTWLAQNTFFFFFENIQENQDQKITEQKRENKSRCKVDVAAGS